MGMYCLLAASDGVSPADSGSLGLVLEVPDDPAVAGSLRLAMGVPDGLVVALSLSLAIEVSDFQQLEQKVQFRMGYILERGVGNDLAESSC